ncbi:MAG: cysteine dioxygenase family protein [Alphaproteobacteria bacterium]|nr:cysteine dioxygenase family protein [Alphaproteobacteria bacterium]
MAQLQPVSVEHSAAAPSRRAGSLGALAVEISLACADAVDMEPRIRAALERAAADPDLLTAEQREPKEDCYARHVVYSDPFGRFTILAIVWGAGQFSPTHAHDTWCAYAVHDGPLRETVYALDATRSKAKPICTTVRNPGYSCFAGAGLEQIHRLGNAGTTPAISIHVYGVERQRISTHVNRVLEIAE